jgi:hypothetical protein
MFVFHLNISEMYLGPLCKEVSCSGIVDDLETVNRWPGSSLLHNEDDGLLKV